MKAITVLKKVVNERLGNIEANVHLVPQPLSIDIVKKTVEGMVHSFKSDKLTECLGENGLPQASIVNQFNMKNVDITKIEEEIKNYLDLNLDNLIGK